MKIKKAVIFSCLLGTIVWLAPGCQSLGKRGEPGYADYYEKGMLAYGKDNRKAARENFQAALRKNPRSALAHFYLAVLYAEEEKFNMAIIGFTRVLQLEPNFPEAYYNLGTLYLGTGDTMESIRMLEQAVFLNPDDAAAFVNLGKAYFLMGMAELSGAAFEEALRRDPENAIARKNLQILARGAGEMEFEKNYRKDIQNSRGL